MALNVFLSNGKYNSLLGLVVTTPSYEITENPGQSSEQLTKLSMLPIPGGQQYGCLGKPGEGTRLSRMLCVHG